MSLLDKASLVITPNAVKASKLYSVVPNTTLGDMDVVRDTTATRVNSAGLIESVGVNIPRIDYTNGSCPSLLVEPQRTNLLTYSNSFIGGTGWSTAGSTVTRTPNFGISPDGTQNSTRIQFSTSGLNFFKSITASNASASIYIKGTAGQTINFYIGSTDQLFTLNGQWQRIERFAISVTQVSLSTFNSATARDIEIFGAQLEVGSYPTSYIPTVATVTRNADVISKTGISSLINSEEGVFFVEIAALSNDLTRRVISLTDGTLNNLIKIELKNTSNQIEVALYNGTTQALILNTLSNELNSNKIAFKYKLNDFSLFVNGTKVGFDTLGSVFSSNTLNTISFSLGGSNAFYGNLKSLQLYKTDLTDQECINLTTL